MRCLECWASVESDPFHLDCTGEHFVSEDEADAIRLWLNGRRNFMIRTGQRAATMSLAERRAHHARLTDGAPIRRIPA